MQSIAFYLDGIYENITKIETLGQILLQVFLPMSEDRKIVNKSIALMTQSTALKCDVCKQVIEKATLYLENKQGKPYIILVICEKCVKDSK